METSVSANASQGIMCLFFTRQKVKRMEHPAALRSAVSGAPPLPHSLSSLSPAGWPPPPGNASHRSDLRSGLLRGPQLRRQAHHTNSRLCASGAVRNVFPASSSNQLHKVDPSLSPPHTGGLGTSESDNNLTACEPTELGFKPRFA